MTSLAASLHAAGLHDEELSLVSRPAIKEREAAWVESVVTCASALDRYWGGAGATQVFPLENDFTPPPRFENLTPVGHGGMGVVYSALDTQTGELVAIKVGNSLEGDSSFIKREFRTLAEIRHPNLVVLKELHQFNGSVFFSMEYIRGERFSSKSVKRKGDGCPWTHDQLAAMSDLLLQLVNGIDFLHREGYVHCDIKPSNVLVTRTGRIVVLDLGLARPSRPQRHRQAKCFGGTTAYMSPEQASGESPQPASDWYSFGVLMFEALFGSRPFRGTPVDVLFDKLAGNAAVPKSEESGVPESLSSLCLGLLRPDPSERPSVEEIRRCLESFSNQDGVVVESLTPQSGFFGRQRELETLKTALMDSARASGPTLLFVEGESGIGKTHLIQKFLEGCRASSETIVLSGRCYENERIPYKAIDAIVGEMAAQWRLHGDPEAVSASLINSISSVFKGFSSSEAEPNYPGNAKHVPQAVADGLHAVLRSLCSQGKRFVIYVDDVQWADADSGELLSNTIDEIPLLLICSHRPMEQPNQFLAHLTDKLSTERKANSCSRELKIGPFNNSDAEQFLEQSFPSLSKQALDKTIAASAGVPMFLSSLAQQICAMPAGQIKSNTLDWTKNLDPQAERLLNFICVSGYQLPQAIALEAAQINEEWEASVSVLCSRQLITLSHSNGEVKLTPFHDMIRESVSAQLDASERRTVHSSIAYVSEGKADVPPDRLAFHFREAGVEKKCCHYSTLAGDVAAKSHAFDEAVRAYKDALSHFVGTSVEKRELKQRMALSLGHLGRSSEAGDVYFELGSQDNGDPHFLQQAAFQYCVAGRIEDALQGFNRLLKPYGYTTTYKSGTSVIWRLAWIRLRLRGHEVIRPWLNRWKTLLGINSSAGPASGASDAVAPQQFGGPVEITFSENRLCDLLWEVGIALSFFDGMQAALFINYSQRVAVRQNDKLRILRGNIWRASHEALFGFPKEKLVRELLNSTDTPTTKSIPYFAGLHLLSSGLSDCFMGKWEEAFEKLTQAEEQFTANVAESAFLSNRKFSHLDQMGISYAQFLGLFSLSYTGTVKSTTARYRELMALPANREHLLNLSNIMCFHGPFVSRVDDKPAEAHVLLDKALKMWPADKLCFQHVIAEYGRAQCYLYTRDYCLASETIEKIWKRFSWSSHYFSQNMRILMVEIRGRCAITRLETAQGRSAERVAKRMIKKLEREKVSWAYPMAQRVRACLELKKQNFAAAKISLLAARDGFEQCKMEFFQYAAEEKLCEISGEIGTERSQIVREWSESQGFKNWEACVGVHYPVGS